MRPATAFLIPVLILSFALRPSARPMAADNESALLADTTVIDTIPPADDRHNTDDADPAPTDSTRTDEGLRDGGSSSPDYLNGVINAPEQPEGAAFTPTMMGDIEAASPTAGINIIAPPSANNHGTAALQYPFIMPPARNGMQPSLGLAYDSDAGDGICGEGWTLPVPSITVDTRWGVPRYDMGVETETYLMDGRMLAMQVGDSLYLAHRHPGIDRNTTDTLRRFHPRTGTDFSLVERVGTSPGAYHWRVTAPDGTVYTYGDGNAKLKGSFTDASGATREVVSEWLLSRIDEPHGDYVTYYYHTAGETVIGGLSATAVYLDSVKAGNAEGPEHTVVTFHYAPRGDGAVKSCSARYGFLTSSHQLLDTVVVRFLGDTLRSYVLQYAEGRFGRPLLARVTHYDDHGNAAAFQEFSYYDDVGDDDPGVPLFLPNATSILSPSTEIKADFAMDITDGGGFFQHPTAIGGSTVKSFGASLYAGVGTGVTNDKSNTVGVNVGFSRSTTKGAVALADLNGDGLPDQVYRLDGHTYYRPMVADGNSYSFGPSVRVPGSPDFSKTVSTTVTGGPKGHLGLGIAGVAELGIDLMRSTSKTTAYMADVNADGMTDIVSNGRVHFGNVDESGFLSFSTSSSSTPNPMSNTDTFDFDEEDDLSAERDTLMKYSPMQDVVRMWKAPFAGTVNITGTAQLLLPANPVDEEGEPVSPDGVHVSIQRGDIELCSSQMTAAISLVQTNCTGITVAAGDTIFFRVQCGRDSLSNGYHDKVHWSQTVKYVGTGLSYPTMPNGESQNIYRSEESAFVSSGMPVDVNGNNFTVRGTLTKVATTDDVFVRIWTMNEQYDTVGLPNPDFQRRLRQTWALGKAACSTDHQWVVSNPEHDPYALLEVYSASNVDWNGVSWTPELIADGDTTAVVPHYFAYPMQRWRGTPYKATTTDSLVITPVLSVNGTRSVNMTVKSKGAYVTGKRLEFVNGVLTGADNTVRIKPAVGDSIWVEYFIEDDADTASTSQPKATFRKKGTNTTYLRDCNLFQQLPESPCGTMYRGWGAFAYGAGGDRYSQPIDRPLLILPADSIQADPLGMAFIPLIPRVRDGHALWNGANDGIYVCGDTLSAARLLVNDVVPKPTMPGSSDPPSRTEGEARGITLKTTSNSWAVMTSYGMPPLMLSMSDSHGSSESSTAFTDMNGDGYPDIVKGGTIHYTNTLGGFSGETHGGFGKTEEASCEQDGAGLGATPQHAHTLSGRQKVGAVENSNQQASNAGCDWDADLAIPHGSDDVTIMLSDVNGDGLPDKVSTASGHVKVRLNLGYAFTEELDLTDMATSVESTSNIGLSASMGVSLPTGYDHGATSFAGGLSTAASQWAGERTFTDINGDGLPDLVRRSGPGVKARINNGAGFFPEEIVMTDFCNLGSGSSTTMSANFAATFSIFAMGAKFTVTPSGNVVAAMSNTTAAIRDIDGDGFPDLVTSNSEDSLSVRFSSIRRTNKLKSVTNSLGGTFTIDYAHTTPTYGLPGGKWVMSSVEVDRGIHFSGYDIPVTRTAFEYSGGKRDRREREFLGFAQVVSTDLDARNGYAEYRSVKETFDVSSFYRKGLPLTSTLQDAQGNKYTKVSNTYYTYSVRPDASNTLKFSLDTIAPSDTLPMSYTPVMLSENLLYEGGSTPVRTQSGYVYKTQGCGEVATYYHSSDGTMTEAGTGFTGYDYRTDISYSYAQANNSDQRRTISRPNSVVVTGGDGVEYHRTTASYLTGRNAAKVDSITRNFSVSSSDTTIVRFTYDASTGNLKSVEQNSGTPGGGTYKQSYTYDEDHYLKSYPYLIEDSHGLDTFIKGMDMRYGLVKEVKDPNGNILHTIFDGLGRLSSMRSPKEDTDSSTIDMAYAPVAVMKADGTGIQTPAHAVTTYHLRQPYETMGGLSSTHSNMMRVVTFVDGFGGVLQTRKESVVDNGSGTPVKKVVVNGGATYDGLGRAVKSYYPVQADSSLLMTYQAAAQTSAYGVETEYDVLDRPTKVTAPDGKETLYAYDVAGGRLRTTVTDANGIESETHTDASGRTVKTVMFSDMENRTPIETRYLYDPVGRLSAVVNALGDSTLVSYDMLDRRTMVKHPASGVTRWTYDKLGNVLAEQNETLRAQGDSIRYTWDVDRLTRMVCPDDTVTYVYGQSGNTHLTNIIGRPRFRLDRSGGTEYGYDAMGNVSYEKRTVVVPQKGLATFETAWDYDSYGKLLRMTYPGDERVTYHYNAAGDLDRVYRGKENAGRDYVSYIGYDRFGDRVRVAYGNGTDMRYSYNAKTRRLTTATSRLNGTARASRNYLYDNVGNVFKISGASPVSYTYYYDYDDLYRLVSCTQRYGSGNAVATDTLAMAYDDLWRVTSKSQRLAQKGLMFPGTLNTGYDMDYSYGTAPGTHYQLRDVAETSYRTSATPTLADNILNTHSYSYDPNGNLACESVARKRIDNSTTNQISERKLLWDGENRLRALSENGYVSLYWYDTDGNRTVKEHLGGEAVWVNSAPAGQRTDSVAYTIYPSAYISVTGDRWTKHYYVGSERIASRTGTLSGGFASLNIGDSNSAGNGLGMTIDYGIMCSAEEDSIDSLYSRFGVPYEARHGGTSRENGWHLYLPIGHNGEDDGNNTTDTPDIAQDRNLPHLNGDSQVYFYHRDHLGSTMSVTDSLGATVQQVEYTPWGEVFVERRFGSSGYESPYLFNGKELDEETGLYYYGARYYDPKLSVWYSTDPMQMDYPWVSTYGYCIDNPVKWYDFNGEDWYQDEDGTLQYNPNVHSQKNLKGSQKYKFPEWNDEKHGIHYRTDGSILYKNETAAYNRMWSQANTHYRKGKNGGREVGGFILDNGAVLVLPDYLNDSRTTKMSDYGYSIKNSRLTKGSESFSVLAQIHTHQDTSAPPKPSYYIDGNAYGDFGVSLSMGGKPVFTIGHDGYIYALKAVGKPLIADYYDLPSGYDTRKNLLNGKAKLYLLLLHNK